MISITLICSRLRKNQIKLRGQYGGGIVTSIRNELLLLLVGLLAMLSLSESCGLNVRQVGISEVRLANGERLYFKREARGLDYDVVALSKNGDRCKEADYHIDYILPPFNTSIGYYCVKGNTIHLYTYSDVKPPLQGKWDDCVVLHRFGVKEWDVLDNSYKRGGLTEILVPVQDADCE